MADLFCKNVLSLVYQRCYLVSELRVQEC